jgi:(E)-4-hydroxy-3-methylbut-2-enyl-diphosphate synthase
VELIACPTCGRARIDIAPIARQVREALADLDAPITVAVMGCVVNGPGEAADADLAVCAGEGKAILYRKGKPIATIPASGIIAALVSEARKLARRDAGR